MNKAVNKGLKIYIPRHHYMLPRVSPENPHILADMLVEIDPRDLKTVISHWSLWENYTKDSDPSVFFQSAKYLCKHPIKNGGIAAKPFLWRPIITAHCGSFSGYNHCTEYFVTAMKEVGARIAMNGYNFMYGGGNSGLMGAALRGFTEQLQKQRFEGQYSIQVVPGDFVLGVQSKNGLKPANEGLGTSSDVAIIMPEFVMRRDVLDGMCLAAIAGPGGIGSHDETFDCLDQVKIGKRNTLLFLLNLPIKNGLCYYDNLIRQIEVDVECGMAKPEHLLLLNHFKTPEEVFVSLNEMTKTRGFDPHDVYAKNSEAFAPKIPATNTKTSTAHVKKDRVLAAH